MVVHEIKENKRMITITITITITIIIIIIITLFESQIILAKHEKTIHLDY